MTVPLNVNGNVFQYPEDNDEDWGVPATDWAISVTQGMLQKQGGTFTLTADADFGPNFGLKAIFKSRSANIAQSGVLRLNNTDQIDWRNFANSGDLPLAVNNLDQLTFNGVVIGVSTSGDVVGPGSATDNAIVRFDTTTGKLIQNSLVDLDDAGNLITPGFLVAGTTLSVGGGNGPAFESTIDTGKTVSIINNSGSQARPIVVSAIPSVSGYMIVTGGVTATGSGSGTGYTFSHTSTGVYSIIYTDAFSNPPFIQATLAAGSIGQIEIEATLTTSAVIHTFDSSGTLADKTFVFLAIGERGA